MFKRLLLGILFLLPFLIKAGPSENGRLSVCLHHREASIEDFDSTSMARWILSQKATDKGSGVFGHAWLWIEPPSQCSQKAFEIGHTGETNPQQSTYLEMFFEISQQIKGEPMRVFFEDRQDGACQLGSGGHWPDEVWSFELEPGEYEHLMHWISTGYYDFHRYNLGLHQCCHFVLEALEALGIKLKETAAVKLPKEVVIWNTSLRIWTDPKWSELTLWTPLSLAKALEREGRFEKNRENYLEKHAKTYSLNPFVRLWQKRKTMSQLIRFSAQQISRHVWLWGWQANFASEIDVSKSQFGCSDNSKDSLLQPEKNELDLACWSED